MAHGKHDRRNPDNLASVNRSQEEPRLSGLTAGQ